MWLAFTGSVQAQIADPNAWVSDGRVNAMALSGGTLYIGGKFTHVGPNTGGFAGIDAASGVRLAGWPRVDGSVNAAVPDGAGGWYIGGYFQKVAGLPRRNLAHVRADGTLDGWNPNADEFVERLVVSGGTMYVAGGFTSVGGQSRNSIAALDVATGAATSWNPNPDAIGAFLPVGVFGLAVSGGTVYAAGYFTHIGGQARNSIAALDVATGAATAWNPSATVMYGFNDLAVSGGTVYVAGSFTNIGGQSRHGVAALDAGTGAVTAWNPNATGATRRVNVMAVSGGTVYVGGEFTGIGGQPRNYIAALDAATGLATAWNPNASSDVFALAVSGGTVYAGGPFTHIGGQPRSEIAALDAASGAATAWNPSIIGNGFGPQVLAVSGGTVFAGGEFISVGAQARSGIAALDAATGSLAGWNPNATGGPNYSGVHALAVSGGTVYAGGLFTNIGGQARNSIAALDAATGAATAWNPNATGGASEVDALAVSGGAVYAGGNFTNIGGQPRNFIAALDAGTGAATAWNPSATGFVAALALSGSTVYVGGAFANIGAQPRNYIAALDAATGAATSWNPNASIFVSALAVSGGIVYAGGGFTNIGGQPRNEIAALDIATGLATAWNPNLSGGQCSDAEVDALTVSGGIVYAGGDFTFVGGQRRNLIAELDIATGAATAWDPNRDISGSCPLSSALAFAGDAVFVVGDFSTIGGLAASGMARIIPAPASPPAATVVSPNGGGILIIGNVKSLSWNATTAAPGVESVDLYLSRSGSGGPWELLAAGAPNTGAYDWTVTGPDSRNCYLRVDARDHASNIGSDVSDAAFAIGETVGLDPEAGNTVFALGPAVPNPCRERAHLAYVVPRRTSVRLTLLDVQGRELALLAEGERGPGRYDAPIDASALRPGLYFVRMQAPNTDKRQRFVILK